MNEFFNAIVKKSYDGQNITENEFLNYYADCNATLPHEKEEYFVDVIPLCHNISNERLLSPHGASLQELTMSPQIDLHNLKPSFLKKLDRKLSPKTMRAKP